jgi:pyruvate formate lyase activating enzyme
MVQLFRKSGDKLECLLCPHFCKIANGKTGICGVRKNSGNSIDLLTYGVLSGYSLDPLEKKPLYHFYPGYNILSIGSYGCNMRCDFCQNYHISQYVPSVSSTRTGIEKIINDSFSGLKNVGVAFTYNEPVIWYEFIKDVALEVQKEGLKTALVSNGFVNMDPLNEIINFTDAFNIDLKAFNNDFYRKLTGADIEPVKNTLKQIVRSGKHLEITTLIIPGQNDDEQEMKYQVEWIAGELGKNVPLHLSRYFPMFQREDPSTPLDTLERLFSIASERLDYVYMGNAVSHKGQDTYCPSCGNAVTKRSGYRIHLQNLSDKGGCSKCGTIVYSNFIFSSLPKS